MIHGLKRNGKGKIKRQKEKKMNCNTVSLALFPEICFKNQIRLAESGTREALGVILFPRGINLNHLHAIEKTFNFAAVWQQLVSFWKSPAFTHTERHCCLFSLTSQNRDARIRFPDAASLFLRAQFEFQAEMIHFAGYSTPRN